MPTIFIIHPSSESRQELAASLASACDDVRTFASSAEFLRDATAPMQGCVIALLELGVTRALVASMRERNLPVVVLGHDSDVATAVELIRAGAVEYIDPPVSPRRLRAAVRKALAAD